MGGRYIRTVKRQKTTGSKNIKDQNDNGETHYTWTNRQNHKSTSNKLIEHFKK